MRWKKFFQRGLIIISAVFFLLGASFVGAAVQIFDGSGQYIMSDDGNHEFGKKRAQQRAERDAQKKAGVYITSFSRSVNAILTDDEISAVTNNIIKVSDVKIVPVPFEAQGESGLMYKATLKATIDTDGIFSWINRNDNEKITIIKQNNNLQEEIQKNDALDENLKEKYKGATTQAEKNTLRKQMEQSDNDFLANQKLEEGNKLYYSKNYDGAAKIYGEALGLKPNWDWAYNNRGAAYNGIGKYQQAIQDLNKAIELNPNNSEVYNNLGNSYLYLQQYQQAISYYNKAIQLNSNDSKLYNNRGEAYRHLNQFDSAISDYNNALKLNQNFAEAYNNRGVTYMDGFKQYERAISDYNRAIQLNSNYAEAYYNRGNAYINQNQFDSAISDYNNALKLNPDFYQAYYNLGIIYYNQKKYELAIQNYSKAIEFNPNFFAAYLNRGLNYALTGNLQYAIDDANKAIQLNPNSGESYYLRGVFYQELGDMQKAQADFAKAKQLGYNC